MASQSALRIREQYILVNCCQPRPDDPITGYHSHDDCIKVHRSDCPNLANLDQERLIALDWKDVLVLDEFVPDDVYHSLEPNDFRILGLHKQVGLDYSLKVARLLTIDRQEVFDRHKKLLSLGLLRRVPKVMIRYRKGVVDNKWIKHRNHTYYELTEKGNSYIEYFQRSNKR